jgi:hypothetical protein
MLVPAAFAVQFQSGRRPVVKIIAESQHDKKRVVPTLLSGIRVGKRREVVQVKPINNNNLII